MSSMKLDLTGKQYGGLTVLRPAKSRYTKSGMPMSYWLCRCQCGVELEVSIANLRSAVALERPRLCKKCGIKYRKERAHANGIYLKNRTPCQLTQEDIDELLSRKTSRCHLAKKYQVVPKTINRWLSEMNIWPPHGKVRDVYFELDKIQEAIQNMGDGVTPIDAAEKLGIGISRFLLILAGWNHEEMKENLGVDMESRIATYDAYSNGLSLTKISEILGCSKERTAQYLAWYAGYLAKKKATA